MKAMVLHKHGGFDELKYVTDFPDPVAKEDHVVIRVGATSFNYHDVFTVRGATAGHDPKEDLRYIWSFELQIIGSNSFYDENLKALMELIQQGKMKPVIDEVLPLERAVEGLRLIESREVFGKVVVTP